MASQGTLRTCDGPPTRPTIPTVTLSSTKAAHMLHYLKPEPFGLHVRRGPGEVRRHRISPS